ncbi:MAG: hypothetical protein RLZZ399_2935 [Verrucomicrobiota bacterium]|jgi:glucose-6-phosphate dehydrogenase assembly protein OpcA
MSPATPFDPAVLGFPVELGQVTRQLKKLWETEGEAKTRASLVNLAVYVQGTDTLEENTHLLAQCVRNHACRAILVGDSPSSPGPKISAWIQAHCHLNKAGAKQICSEQITLLAEGVSEEGVANALMSNLDYDLPLLLWWRAPLPESTASPLWTWVDRLIFDSATWDNPLEQLGRLRQLKALSDTRMALSDLNWTRSLAIRQAIAQCFDAPDFLAEIPNLDRIEIAHGHGARLTAILVAAWFAAQIGWTLEHRSGDTLIFRASSGCKITCVLAPTSSEIPIPSLRVASPNASLQLEREAGSALLHALLRSPQGTREAHYSAGAQSLKDLLGEELNPGIRHKVYQKALQFAETLL